nr:hypothetical protein [Citrobacter sp. wls619]
MIVSGKLDQNRADRVLNNGYADLVTYGDPFVANPVPPRRLAEGLPLENFNGSALFGVPEQGYNDDPARG